MKRIPFVAVILSVLLAGCITVFEPVATPTAAPTEILLPTNVPTQEPVQSVVPPTESQSVPLCTVDPLYTACAAPKVEQRDKYCVEKAPYNQYATAPGITFEAVEPGLKCADQGLRNGEQVIACTGQGLTSYTLKVCNAACSPSALTVDAAKCPDGYGYSAEASCCWPVPATDAGCVFIKVDIGACK